MVKLNLVGEQGAGKSTVIDENFSYLARYSWHLNNYGYAVASVKRDSKYTTLSLHRLVNETPLGLQTDHINGDKLDNRSANLRTATASQNQANTSTPKDNTSGVKGVRKVKNRWRAELQHNRKRLFLGSFVDKNDAAAAYADAATRVFREFYRN